MSYNDFQRTFWSEHIQRELEKLCVLAEDCDYTFEGEAKLGKKVKILGVGSPTIGDYTGAAIGSPEVVEDSSVYLEIEKAKYFNFMVDDVDAAQSVKGLMEKLMEEATAALAVKRDSYIAGFATNAGSLSASAAVTTSDAAIAAVDTALAYLWNNGVKVGSDISLTMPVWFYNLFKGGMVEKYTDNVELIRKGVVGMYNGARVKISNNLYNDGTDDYIMVRTKKAIAFASQIEKTEAYRPQGYFSDAVKGLDVYGAKVVRPKEMYVIKAHSA